MKEFFQKKIDESSYDAVFLCSLRNGQVGTALGKFLINLNDSEVKNQAPSF